MRKLLVVALLMSSLSAHALVFIEPMLGYSTGKLNATVDDGSSITDSKLILLD